MRFIKKPAIKFNEGYCFCFNCTENCGSVCSDNCGMKIYCNTNSGCVQNCYNNY